MSNPCAYLQQKSAPPQRPKQSPVRSLEPLADKIRNLRSGKVKVATLFNSIDLQGDYEAYTMVYDGRRFRTLLLGSGESREPTKHELVRFLRDIVDAAHKDKEVLNFLQRYPISLPEEIIRMLSP